MDAPDPRAHLSIDQFSAAIGLSVCTVRRRIRDGSLTVCQPGVRKSRVLIPHDALARPAGPPPAATTHTPAASPSPIDSPATSPPSPLAGPPPRWMRRTAL